MQGRGGQAPHACTAASCRNLAHETCGSRRWYFGDTLARGHMHARKHSVSNGNYPAWSGPRLGQCCAGSASAQSMVPDPLQVEELLDCMQPAAVRLDLQTSAFDQLKQHGQPSTEPWFDVPFAQCPVPAACLAAWQEAWESRSPRADLALPPRNEFLPSDFSLRSEERGSSGRPHASGAAAVNGTAAADDVAAEKAPRGVEA